MTWGLDLEKCHQPVLKFFDLPICGQTGHIYNIVIINVASKYTLFEAFILPNSYKQYLDSLSNIALVYILISFFLFFVTGCPVG